MISGALIKLGVIKEDSFGSGTGTNTTLGYIQGYEKKADTHTEAVYSLNGDPKPVAIIDGVLEISGSIEWQVASGEELECIMGGYDSNTGQLFIANTLPSYSFIDTEDDTYHIVKGVKFERVSLTSSKNNFLTARADWIGVKIEETSTEPTINTPSTPPFYFTDGYLEINGVVMNGVDNFTLEINRNTKSYRGLAQTTTGTKRLVTNIIEGKLDIAMSGTVVAQKEIYREVMGGATLQDTRNDVSIVLNFSNGSKTLTLTITGRITFYDKKEDKDQEVVMTDFNAIGLDIQGTIS